MIVLVGLGWVEQRYLDMGQPHPEQQGGEIREGRRATDRRGIHLSQTGEQSTVPPPDRRRDG
jgi:hypothetical protein